MNSFFLSLYRSIFARPALYKLNLHLYKLTLRGLGVLNAEGASVTGEAYFLEQLKTLAPHTIIDIGANTDVYGLQEFPEANIYAFEPHPKTFQKLKQTTAGKHAHLHLFNLGMSDRSGNAKLWDFANNAPLKSTQPTSTLSSLHRDVIEDLHHQPTQGFEVKLTTLDEFTKQQKIFHIDVLKIDTEGHELAVLQGAKKLLTQNAIDIIQFEFNEMNVVSGAFLHSFIRLLPNYTFYRLLPNGLLPLGEYRPLTHEIFGFQNIVAVSDSISNRFP